MYIIQEEILEEAKFGNLAICHKFFKLKVTKTKNLEICKNTGTRQKLYFKNYDKTQLIEKCPNEHAVHPPDRKSFFSLVLSEENLGKFGLSFCKNRK